MDGESNAPPAVVYAAGKSFPLFYVLCVPAKRSSLFVCIRRNFLKSGRFEIPVSLT